MLVNKYNNNKNRFVHFVCSSVFLAITSLGTSLYISKYLPNIFSLCSFVSSFITTEVTGYSADEDIKKNNGRHGKRSTKKR